MALTLRQIQILRWLDENPSNSAGWTVNGREPKAKEGPDTWTHMKIEGPTGSILIAAEDNEALHELIIGCPTGDKIYGPSEAGKAAIAETISLRGG